VAAFLAHIDAVGKVLLAILLLMSLGTWTVVVAKLFSRASEARRGRQALEQARRAAGGASPELVSRALGRALNDEMARLESGLTLLASVGATAPFVGLFGTVWAVYHALASIGVSGQSTLDKVAGPVGEALIMTALGLAVAIPAVLAYNAFVRANRLLVARLESLAHDLYAGTA
jgi:biopolymer transport protein ExbB